MLWGCSVEPSAISDKMAADLKKYDLITARESITYETLKALNVNTVLVPDPAFTLEKTAGKLPDGFCEGRMIGINISPLIQSKESKQGMAFANYEYLIRWILAHTDYGVALIPHVVWDYNDDRIPLQKLLEEFADTGRVCLAEDQNCMQLKDVISKCAFFIGARTHATIAAYSTQVPTLVVGYSVKARGIAKDIFGTEENFVLPVQNLENQEDLCRAFQWMLANEHKIREKLAVVMPEYIRNAWELKNLIRWENHR